MPNNNGEKKYSFNGHNVSWRDYVDLRFLENQRAIDKAERTMNSRLESMNEFRDTLKDQASKFITREETLLIIKPILDSVKTLENSKATLDGKASQSAVNFSSAISVIGMLIAIMSLIINLVRV